MAMAAAVGVVSSAGGLFLATVVDVPCSAMIVLLQIGVYLLSRVSFSLMMRRKMQ